MKKVLCGIFILTLLFSLCGCGDEDHNDGKCDICGKSSTYSDGDEEYCDKHLRDAVNWYIEQGKE